MPGGFAPPFHHLFSMKPLLFQALPDPRLLFPSLTAGAFGLSTAGLVCPWFPRPTLRFKQPQTSTLRLTYWCCLDLCPCSESCQGQCPAGSKRGEPRALLGAAPWDHPPPAVSSSLSIPSTCLYITHLEMTKVTHHRMGVCVCACVSACVLLCWFLPSD